MASFGAGTFGASGGDEQESASILGRAQAIAAGLGHPVPAFFHLLFKTSAILVYMLGTWFSSNFVNMFIVTVLLLAFDFWTVKNVTGRLMVGLRWNSEVLEDGSTTWKFESQEGDINSTTLDHMVFWVGLFAPAPIWLLFGVGSFLRFKFEWLLLIFTALSLSMANIIGYVRCKQDARGKISAGLQGLVKRTGMSSAMGGMLQSAAGSAFGFGSSA